jgi:hypothetical protein
MGENYSFLPSSDDWLYKTPTDTQMPSAMGGMMESWGQKQIDPGFTGIAGPGTGTGGISNLSWGSEGMKQAIGLGVGALQGIGGIGQAYLGMKNYGLAKQQLAQNKQQYWNNFTSQARLTNAELRDRQNARNARARAVGDPGSTMSTEDYMKMNSINEKGYN